MRLTLHGPTASSDAHAPDRSACAGATDGPALSIVAEPVRPTGEVIARLLGGPTGASPELAALAASQGSGRELAEQVLSAVEEALRREVARDATTRATTKVRAPTAKARVRLERLAGESAAALHKHFRSPARAARGLEPSAAMDPATYQRFRHAVDRQLRSTLELSAEARARVIDDAAKTIESTIGRSLDARGLADAPPAVRQGGLLSGLKAVLERASSSVSRLAHGLRHTFSRSEPAATDKPSERTSLGDRISDAVASFGGSWKFIISALAMIGVWATANTALGFSFDPYPFILLNLVLSVLAALQGPVILMSQNRQAARDRVEADETHEASIRAEEDLRALRAEHAELKGMVQKLLDAQQPREPR